ncbi:hypothetical protein D3C85_1210550 [compost metagenome]
MMHGQMLDDGGGFDDRAVAVLQHRKLPHRPQRRQLGEGGLALQQPKLERRAVLIQRDQRLLAVGREGVGVEFHGRHPSKPCSMSATDRKRRQ